MSRLTLTAVLLAAIALAGATTTAVADDWSPWGGSTTCDHTGISSTATKRHVTYLNVPTTYGCHWAQHAARIWVHDQACGVPACTFSDGTRAPLHCTTTRHSTGTYTSRCTRIGYHALLIAWAKLR